MYRIDVPSASPTLPAATAAGTAGYFTDGDPVGGTPATVLPAEFMNMLMMEILSVIAAGGIAPSKGDHTQLLSGIKGLTTGNLVSNGHLSIPVGPLTLILNWGNGAHSDGSGAQPVVFDLPYSTGVLASFATNFAAGVPVAFHGTGNHSKTGLTVYSAASSGVAPGAGTAFRWLAIGL